MTETSDRGSGAPARALGRRARMLTRALRRYLTFDLTLIVGGALALATAASGEVAEDTITVSSGDTLARQRRAGALRSADPLSKSGPAFASAPQRFLAQAGYRR